MRRTSAIRLVLVPLVGATFVALSAAEACASQGGGHPEPSWSLTLLGFANFAIFCWIIKRYAWPPVTSYLQDRRDSIVTAFEAARLARQEASALREEFDRRLRSIEEESQKAREDLLSLARLEADRVLVQARQAGDRIREDARLVADEEISRARLALQQECAELVTSLTAAILTREFTADDQHRFVDDFISRSREAVPS